MSELPDRTTLDPAAPPGMAELSGGGRVVGIVAAAGAHQDGAAAEAAARMADGWSAGGIRMILADGSLAEPRIHPVLGIENGEGISDALVFGSSLRRVARKVDGKDYFAVAAGTVVADPSQAMAAGRWSLLCEGFRDAGVMLAVYLNGEDPSTALALREATHVVVVAGERDEVPSVVFDCGAPVIGVIAVEAREPAAAEAGTAFGAPEAAEEDFDFEGVTDEVAALGAEPMTQELDLGGLADQIAGTAAPTGAAADEDDFEFRGMVDGVAGVDHGPETGEFFGGLADQIAGSGASSGAETEEDDFDFGGVTDEVPALDSAPRTDDFGSGGPADQAAATPVGSPEEVRAPDVGGLGEPAAAGGPPSVGVGGGAAGGAPGFGGRTGPGGGAGADSLTPGGVMGGGAAAQPSQPMAGLGGQGEKKEIKLIRYSPDELPGGRKRKRKEKPSTARQLFMLVLLIVAVVAGDWFGYVKVPFVDIGPTAPESPITGGPGEESPTADPSAEGAPAEQAPAQGFSVALAAYGDSPSAQAFVDRLRGNLPDVLFLVVPVEVNGQIFYRALAGPATNSDEASSLLDRIAAVAGVNSSGWVIRSTPRAFLLEDMADLASARERADELTALGVPAYVLVVDYSDESQRYRVYAGAYENEAEAATLAAFLTDNGVDAGNLADRRGRLPE